MVRIVLLMMTLALAFPDSAEAGWLGDKLKQAAENAGDRLIDDASDSAYEGAKQETKEAIGSEKDEDSKTYGQYDSEKAAEVEKQDQVYPAYSDAPGSEETGQPSWTASDYGRQKKKKKKTGPPRTDLHLSSEMIISDPESSPEPIKGNIYIDGARLRTEWKYPDSNLGMIVTGVHPTDKVYMLIHKEKTYMESSYAEADFFSFGSSKPCDEFRKAEDIGRTKLYGRSVVKWRCSEPKDPETYEESSGVITVWFDDKLDLPVRIEDGKGYWELVNIREGKPSGDHFKVPAGYKKLAIGAIPTALSLPDKDEQLIKSAGIPLYSKARFVYGNNSVGYRFASSEPLDNVRAWYKKKLSSWPVYEDKYGSWIIYKGKPGANMGELIMQKNQVSVQKNDKLPEWHSLDKNMTTEILIQVVQ